MIPTLYFLRSSEAKIAKDMTKIVYENDLEKYYKNYGLNSSDLGLYALVQNQIAGAAWIRFIDNKAILSVGVKKEFRNQKIASHMLNQLFLEAGAIYDSLHVEIDENAKEVSFLLKLGFIKVDESSMKKEIKNETVVRPSDGYDPRKWMD